MTQLNLLIVTKLKFYENLSRYLAPVSLGELDFITTLE